MNTSPEMLESTYASCDSGNFAQIVNKIVKDFEKAEASENEDKQATDKGI